MRTFRSVSVFAVALSLSCHQLKTIAKKPGDPQARVRGVGRGRLEPAQSALSWPVRVGRLDSAVVRLTPHLRSGLCFYK
jgi:hypothetical protein